MEVPGVFKASVNLATETVLVELDSQQVVWSMLAQALGEAGYPAKTGKLTLNIGGMTCASCVVHVQDALTETPGVLSASVSLASERATVRFFLGGATL